VIGRLLLCSASAVQFTEGTRPQLCIVERNSPTPVRRRFSLTQEGLGRVILGGERQGGGINMWRQEYFSAIPISTYDLSLL